MSPLIPAPVGLLSPQRQSRLLRALARRHQRARQDQVALRQRQAAEQAAQQQQIEELRVQTTEQCRGQRRQLLEQWDLAEEKLIADYESGTVRQRGELTRLSARFRKQRKAAHQVVLQRVAGRNQAVQQQHDSRRHAPVERQQREAARIGHAVAQLNATLEEVRALTVRRLDELPDVPVPAPGAGEPHPRTVSEAVAEIQRLREEIADTLRQLQSGSTSKAVDSYWLLGGGLLFLGLWCLIAYLVAPRPVWISMLVGVPIVGVLGFALYGALLWPLRKATRQLYPRAEHLAAVAGRVAETGRQHAAANAAAEAAALLKERDVQLAAIERWKVENLESLDRQSAAEEAAARQRLQSQLQALEQDHRTQTAALEARMREQGDALAAEIMATLARLDEDGQQQIAALAQRHAKQQQRAAIRLRHGIAMGLERVDRLQQTVADRFPPWDAFPEAGLPAASRLDFLPLGNLRIDNHLRSQLQDHAAEDAADALDAALPQWMPVALHRRLHAGMIIHCLPEQRQLAVDLVHAMLWRLLTGVTPGRLRLTLIDPVGRGQHFASFLALADHDPALVGHRVWTSPTQIEARLSELAHHCEDVLQSCLRDAYETIEAYNEIAGAMAEPYRVVAAVGFPAGLTRDGAGHLRALLDAARRCGTLLMLVCDRSQPWPSDVPPLDDARLLRLTIRDDGRLVHSESGLADLEFEPLAPPPPALRGQLTDRVGRQTVAAGSVEIPLDQILASVPKAPRDSADGLAIPIGSQGGNRPLELRLGEGVRQHVLIAGKTGSGKSTLLHSIITAGARLYRPDQLHFYLLDFKKGVEFRVYADGPLPHARVIGIESEREFGRSVLERLDAELQQRGEAFRQHGVQSLSDLRQTAAQTLPRILLVVDEFQELFVRDDRLAAQCAMLLDRLVRQGRSFGIHVILSSQSLAGAYSLPRATLGQMAVRVALQCGESDAALILSEDNTAARLISRPGEAIYNDAGGLVEGNQPFQVAWLTPQRHQQMLQQLTERDAEFLSQLGPAAIFEGSRPTPWTAALANASASSDQEPPGTISGLLGEATEIGPPAALRLHAGPGRNVLLVAPPEPTLAVLATVLPSMVVDGARQCGERPKVVLLDANRAHPGDAPTPAAWLAQTGLEIIPVRPRDAETELARLAQLAADRLSESAASLRADEPADDVAACGPPQPVIVVITPLERFRELRQSDSFQFSLDDAGAAGSGSDSLQALLRDGPQAGVFTILCCQSPETLSRWLPRSAHHDLELRVLARMSASDSANLIDSPEAADLSVATMLIYDDADGRQKKFRFCELPKPAAVESWCKAVLTS